MQIVGFLHFHLSFKINDNKSEHYFSSKFTVSYKAVSDSTTQYVDKRCLCYYYFFFFFHTRKFNHYWIVDVMYSIGMQKFSLPLYDLDGRVWVVSLLWDGSFPSLALWNHNALYYLLNRISMPICDEFLNMKSDPWY